MAKSSNFFGLRRGSTKSLTFSVLDGQQITKDRVTYIRNPKTALQADQRMRMTLAKNFWQFNKATLDHAFEGYRQGLQNFQQFMKIALATNNSVFPVKGSTEYIPANFQYSKGSLSTIYTTIAEGTGSRSPAFQKTAFRFMNLIPQGGFDLEGLFGSPQEGVTKQQLLNQFCQIIGASLGDQITAVLCYQPSSTIEDELTPEDFVYKESRGFLSINDNGDVDFAEKWTEAGINFLLGGVTEEDTESYAMGWFGLDNGTTLENILGAAVIISRYDSTRQLWLRSNSFYAVSPQVIEQFGSDTAYEQALASYQTSESAGASDLYLNGSANIVVKRLAVSIAKSSIAEVDGKRVLIGYDGTGAKLGITNTAGHVYGADGSPITYTPTEGEPTFVTASDITNWVGLSVVALTESQVQQLL